jgi:hypothetical protein
MWDNYEQQGAEHNVMGTARDSFTLTASYLSAYSLCPGISLTYTAVVSLKIDHFAYDVNVKWNNNMHLEERWKIKNSAFQLQHSQNSDL